MNADDSRDKRTAEEIDRASRLARQRGSWRRRAIVSTVAVVVVVGAAVGTFLAVAKSDKASGASQTDLTNPAVIPTTSIEPTSTSSTVAPTPASTLPHVDQPPDQVLPDPGSGIGIGASGPVVLAYEARMKALHFDPGPVDGVFGQDTQYAVTTVQKYFGLPRTGRINTAVDLVLTHFTYSPAEPNSEPDRVEIDLDRETLTLYKDWQPELLTTTSTGSGEHFCGGVDGCQYAITPTGHFHFYELHKGWQTGKLGSMWNPYYFNGSDAVHGLASVPAYPASHGCARIPMHIANYFYTLVHQGESVFVVGTAKKAGNGYVGPVPTTVPTPTTVKAAATPTTIKKGTTPTTKPSATPTTVKSASKPPTPTTVKKHA